MKDFLFSIAGREMLEREYVQNERSSCDIAAEIDTYTNMVNRALKYHGFRLRNRSEAQIAALKSGRHLHPTKGRKRDQEERENISQGMANAWKEMSEQEREGRVNQSKQQWSEMTDSEREQLAQLAADGIRKAATEGSKLEQYLLVGLRVAGYDVTFHQEFLISEERMHVDLVIKNPRVAIEVDGPSHHLPIWGEENLARTIVADNKKTGLLMQAGFVVVRIKNLIKTLSEYHKRGVLDDLLLLLKEVEKAFPPEGRRLCVLEVK